MPRFDSLSGWLDWQETLHPEKIDLRLDRVAAVGERMALLQPAHTVITVAGTNGKGSSVALLDAILRAAGYRVGSYTSPHILHYNERIRLDGKAVGDAALCEAFEHIDQARGNTTLTYFEFGTLAALAIFKQSAPDVAILEVGMGGRLDAVNIVKPDAALVTSISIDHRRWLGNDRETIGREKAAIFRPGRPAICSDPQPPASLEETATRVGAEWYALGRQYSFEAAGNRWHWHGSACNHDKLPLPALPGAHQLNNAAGVLMVLEALGDTRPVTRQAIEEGLQAVDLAGRCQIVPGTVETVFDVAHNPDSARTLVQVLQERPLAGRTRLVLGMLEDKDVERFTTTLAPLVDDWYLASLEGERGLSAQRLQQRLSGIAPADRVHCYANVCTAFRNAHSFAKAGDRVVVCGSFVTVAEALACHV